MIGAVGYWYKGDYHVPLSLMEELNSEGIEVVDLSGALKSISFLSNFRPGKIVVLASEKRGKRELRRYEFEPSEDKLADWAEIHNFKAYYSDVDTFLKMLNAFGVVERALVIECEVVNEDGEMSDWGRTCRQMMKEEVYKLLR
jgi:hypothetical protein